MPLAALISGIALMAGAAAPADAQTSTLSVPGDTPLEVKATEGDDAATAYITLLNAGEQPLTAEVTFQAASSTAIEGARASATIPAGEAKRLAVQFTGLAKLEDPVQGELVIKGGSQPVARSVEITPAPQPSASWPQIFVLGALGAMLLLIATVAIVMRAKKKAHVLLKKAPGPKWSFDSWATTATAIGAILGTVLGGATLPETPSQIDKESLIALNLLFGGLVVLAPFVFQAIRKPTASAADPDAGLWGYNLSLLFACALTGGAVLGELATLALLGWELTSGGGWGIAVVAALAAVGLLAAYYFAVTSWSLATTDWEALAAKKKAEAQQAQRKSLREAAPEALEEAGAPVFLTPPPVALPAPRWSLP
jgi:hypothetical protein